MKKHPGDGHPCSCVVRVGPVPGFAGAGVSTVRHRHRVQLRYLTVPENRSDREGPTIRLLVATLPAASATPEPDPIVWMTGGPGSPMASDVNVAAGLGINADRDAQLFGGAEPGLP